MSREKPNSSERERRVEGYSKLRKSIIEEFQLGGLRLMHPFFSCLLIKDPKNFAQLVGFKEALKDGSKLADRIISLIKERKPSPVSITSLIEKILSSDSSDKEKVHFAYSDQKGIITALKTKVLEIGMGFDTLHLLSRPCFIDTENGSLLAVVAQDLLPDGTVVISIRKIENVGEKPVIFIFTPAIDKNGMHTYLCIKSNSQDIDPRGITEEELLLLLNAGIVFVPSRDSNDPRNKTYLSLQSNPNQRRFSANQSKGIPIDYPDNPSLQAIKDSGLLGIQEKDYYVGVFKLLIEFQIVDNDALNFLSEEIFSRDAEVRDLLEEYSNYLSDTKFTEFLEKIKGFFASSKYKILIDLGMARILWQIYKRKKISSVDLSSIGISENLSSGQKTPSRDLQIELAKQQIIEAIILLSEPGNSKSSILMRTVLSNYSKDQLLKLLEFLIEKRGISPNQSTDVLEIAYDLISQVRERSNRGMLPSSVQIILNPQLPIAAETGPISQQIPLSTVTTQGTSQVDYSIVKKTTPEDVPLTVEDLMTQLNYCVNNSLPFKPDLRKFPTLRFSNSVNIAEEFVKLKILSAFLNQSPRDAERFLSEIHKQIESSGNRYFLKLALRIAENVADNRVFGKNKIKSIEEVTSYYQGLIPKLQNYPPEALYNTIVFAILDYGFWVSNQEIDPSLLNIIDKCIREAHEYLSKQATQQFSLVKNNQTRKSNIDDERKSKSVRLFRFKFKKENLYRLASTLGLISILYFGGRHINDQVLNPRITIPLDGQGNVLPANSISSLQDHIASLFREIFVQGEDKIEECRPPKNPIFEEVNSKPSQDFINRTRDMKLIGEIDQEYGDKNFVNLEKDKVYFVVVYNNEGEPVVVTSFLGMDAEIRRTEGMVLSKVFLLPEEIEDIFDTIPKPICENPRYNNLLNQGGIQAIVVTVESNRSNSRVSIMGNHRVKIPSLDRLLGIEAPQIKSSGIIRKDVLLIEVPYELTK